MNALMASSIYTRGIILCCQNSSKDHDSDADFQSRFFGPKAGIPEDPVTGSAHCLLAPYFGKLLGIDKMVGRQASLRGGIVKCTLQETSSISWENITKSLHSHAYRGVKKNCGKHQSDHRCRKF